MDKDNQIPKYVTQARAAYLLGLPMEVLSEISSEAGIGHMERAGDKEEWFFTYEELQKICVLAAEEQVAVH
jgi:hypothetical protein